jgi:hypothetical protein
VRLTLPELAPDWIRGRKKTLSGRKLINRGQACRVLGA